MVFGRKFYCGISAYGISRKLRDFSLSKAVDKIRKNEELMAQIKARIDLLGEPGMRLTE